MSLNEWVSEWQCHLLSSPGQLKNCKIDTARHPLSKDVVSEIFKDFLTWYRWRVWGILSNVLFLHQCNINKCVNTSLPQLRQLHLSPSKLPSPAWKSRQKAEKWKQKKTHHLCSQDSCNSFGAQLWLKFDNQIVWQRNITKKETSVKIWEDPVLTMQKTGWTNHSAFQSRHSSSLVWFGPVWCCLAVGVVHLDAVTNHLLVYLAILVWWVGNRQKTRWTKCNPALDRWPVRRHSFAMM